MKTLVVLPTYNESATIAEVLRRIRASATDDVDVLVVDDNSPDGTADLAEALAAELGGIEVLRRPHKAGLGSAYREGFKLGLARGYEALVEMDADLSHDPSVLGALVAEIDSGADLAIGTRYMPGGKIPDWPWQRRAISRAGNVYARLMLGLAARDATSGYRAYHRRALERINLTAVRADGYGFQIEMAYKVARSGGILAEVPIEFRDRTLGRSKMSPRIVVEALVLVTWWGLEGRRRARRKRRGPVRA
ncbi:MAG: dolichol-phosphate mannosyltransferase [Actinomycetota bacterium]|jgi:dolichol-phosphate mannosyltransferase|nr:dolichol-phosphate mannosyltransferase [Actinomycetota bacterium]MDQ1568141.1 dolichol-phosphate mannosyltransferase [Actinomycetota bacterium]